MNFEKKKYVSAQFIPNCQLFMKLWNKKIYITLIRATLNSVFFANFFKIYTYIFSLKWLIYNAVLVPSV